MRVAVIGAGVSGSALAYWLAREGVEVEVFEKLPEGRTKPCAGAVLPRALKHLPIRPEGVEINRVRVTTPRHRSVVYERKGMALSCVRARIDVALREAAEAEGAVIHYRREIGDGALRGYDHVVNASGAPHSPILGVEAHVSRVGLEIGDDELYFRVFTFTPAAGYGWVFPKPDGYSVGVAGERGWVLRNADAFFKSVGVDGRRRAGLIAPYDGRRCFRVGGAWLVGDAARLTDPLNYEGITGALLSAAALRDAILHSRDYGEALAPLLKWLERERWILRMLQVGILRDVLTLPRMLRMWLKQVYTKDFNRNLN